MNKAAQIKQFVKQDLWTTDLDTVHIVQRVGIQVLRLAIAVALEIRHRLLDAQAAGLVFTTLLSLVPFLAVMFSVLKAFGVHHQIEPVLETAWAHGARQAGYVLMRLPWEVKDLFKDWLERHYPLKAKHVMSRVHAMRGGRDNDPSFGSRMKGEGELARLLSQRFKQACQRLGFNAESRNGVLDTAQFRVPPRGGQLSLFDDGERVTNNEGT